jgi:hypothetical protein
MPECFIVQSSIIKPHHRGLDWVDDFSFTSFEEAKRCVDRTSPRRPRRIVQASNKQVVHERR